MSLKQNKIIVILFAVALASTSCNRRTIFSHYEHTPTSGWEANDSLTFSLSPVRHDGLYEETVGLRISSAYPFMGLTLVVDQKVIPSGIRHLDTIHAHLINRDGTIQGHGISYFQYEFQLRRLQLNANDSLHFCIRHNMKREILPGVSDVGITIRSVK